MEAILENAPFGDFGEDPLLPWQKTPLSRIDGDSADELKAAVRQYVPKRPGVYGMLDRMGRLLYVGKSKLLRNRLLSYFLPGNEEDKAGRIVQSTASIVWEPQPSEFAALLREQSLIRSFQPRFNVQGMPKRQQPIFICLGRSPAEQFYTARRLDPKARVAIGPLFGATRAARSVEVLNRVFKLRDCSSKQPCSFTEQLQLFDIEMRPGCIRLEIQSCLGPCVSACSRSAYEEQVLKAKSFLLQGDRGLGDHGPIKELTDAMRQAASNLHFEQAVRIREDLKSVKWLSKRAEDMARARENFTFVYPVQTELPWKGSGKGIWYLIRRGVVEGVLPMPRTPAAGERTIQAAVEWFATDNHLGVPHAPRPETLALVTSWFRKHPSELKTAITRESLLAKSDGRMAGLNRSEKMGHYKRQTVVSVG